MIEKRDIPYLLLAMSIIYIPLGICFYFAFIGALAPAILFELTGIVGGLVTIGFVSPRLREK